MIHPFAKRLQEVCAENHLGQPEDIRLLLEYKGARGQNCPAAIFSYIDVSATANLLRQWELAVKSSALELNTVKRICCDWLSYLADRYPRYYHFKQATELTLKAVEAIQDCEDQWGIYEILFELQRYYMQLKYWIDLTLPWKEMSAAYAFAMEQMQ